MSGLSRTLAVLLSLWPAVPMMAQGVGSIAGTITDASGAVVPRVTITLTNPQGTLGGNQTTVTNERGTYQFIRLVPGTYVVKAELQGFRPAEARNVVVDADITSRADLSLELGGVEQGVTVTAETQLLDTTSVQTQTIMTRAELENLPNRADSWSAMKIIPGAILSGQTIDVGGSQGFQQQSVTVRGNASANTFAIDGMDVSAATQTLAIVYLDPVSFQETGFQIAAGGAESSSGGMTFNAVTRTGTNQWHGGVGSPGSTLGGHLASARNFSDQQRADVLATVPAAALKANPNLSPNNDILKFNDFNAWIAGPVIKNKLWVAGTWRDQRFNVLLLGAYKLDGTQLQQNNILRNTTVKVAYQLTKSSQLTYFNNVQYKVNGACGQNCGGQVFTDNLAQGYKSKTPDVNQVKYTGAFGPRLVVDAGYSRLRLHDQTGTEPGVVMGAMSNYDLVTLTRTNALASYSDNSQDRDVVKASGSYITTSHNLRFGMEWDKAMTHARSWGTADMVAQFRNGVPDSVLTSIIAVTKSAVWNAPDVPSWTYNTTTTTSLYLQDRYNVTRRLVANLGVRFEMERAHEDAACLPKTEFFTTSQCYPAVDNAPRPKTILPRVGIIYDLTGKGKTALKFGFNRYSMAFTTSQMSLVKSMLNIGVVTNTRTWTDSNGDRIPQLSELGADPGYSLPQLATNPFVGNILWPYFDEYTAELEQQLPQQIVASVLYSRRMNRDNIGTRNSSIPTSAYSPVTVTEKTTGKVVEVWLRDPAYSKAPTTNVQFNSPLLNTEFSGVELKLNKRLSNHFSLVGGAAFQRTVAHSSGGDLNNPSNRKFDEGVVVGSTPWSYRFSGAYQAPHGVMFSSTFQYDKGLGEMTTVQVGSDTIKFNAGQATTQTVNFAKRQVFLPNIVQLDSSVQKPWHLTDRQTISARMDIYNALNNATITNRVTQLGPTYHRINGIQAGRMLKLGLNYQF